MDWFETGLLQCPESAGVGESLSAAPGKDRDDSYSPRP